MLRDPFFKGLRDQARPLLMWAIGVAFYVALLMSIYPSIRHSAGSLQGYINNLPAAVRAAFLGPGGDFSSPVGYVNVELLSWLGPIVFIAFAVSIAGRSIAGEEENGTLSLLLAHTVGRRRLALQKFGAMTVVVVLLGVAFWLSLFIATRIAGTPVGGGALASAFVRLTLLGLAVGSATYAVGAGTGKRQASVAAGAGVGLVMYLLNTIAEMNDTVRPLRYVSLFHYSGGAAPLGQSLGAVSIIVLLGTSAVLLLASLVLFERRDVHV
jgi:ABC-2 type transport system permease protein